VNRRFKNGAGNDLFVEGPEVFETAPRGEENQSMDAESVSKRGSVEAAKRLTGLKRDTHVATSSDIG